MIVSFTVVLSVFSEALWQPARKVKASENLTKPMYMYVFSTHLANLAAEAVVKGRYDSIVQFHNAQPKDPGILRMPPPKDRGKTETTATRKTSESEKDGVTRASKRRSSRLSVNEDTFTTKRLRTSARNKSPVSMSEDSKHPPTRFSRRIRKQQANSISSPSSPTSDHSSSASSPFYSSNKGRSGQQSARNGGRRGAARSTGSGRRREAEQDGSEMEGEDGVQQEEKSSREGENEEEPTEEAEFAQGGGEEDKVNRQLSDTLEEKSKFDQQESLQDSAKQAAAQELLDEENYTICHPTPRSKHASLIDMPSPASKSAQQTPTSKAAETSSPSSGVIGVPPSHPTQHNIAAMGVTEHQKHSLPGGMCGPLSRDPMLGQPIHPDIHKETANNWATGLGPQFSHVPGGFYGAGIHPMHYSAHATQHMPGANYPYGVPYPHWGHPAVGQPPSRVPEQHPYISHTETGQQQQQQPQHSQPPASSQSSRSPQASSHVPPTSRGSFHHRPSPQHMLPSGSTPVEAGKDLSTATSQAHEPIMNPASSSLPSTQPHHARLPSPLRQMSGIHPSLPPVHHGFPRPPHPLTAEQISAGAAAAHHPATAAFSYGFDPSNPAALSHMHHLWQQSHMQQHQIRPLPGMPPPPHLPPHLQASPGMWYPHMSQLMHGSVPDESAKRRTAAQSVTSKHSSPVEGSALRMNTNRNNTDSSTQAAPTPAPQHSHKDFTHPAAKDSLSSFSVEQLTSQHKVGNTHEQQVGVHYSELEAAAAAATTSNPSLQQMYTSLHLPSSQQPYSAISEEHSQTLQMHNWIRQNSNAQKSLPSDTMSSF